MAYKTRHTTVRITEETREKLRALAEAEGKPMQALLEEAVEALRRLRILQGVNAGFAALRKDRVAWKAVEDERDAWDATLLDGLAVQEAPASRAQREPQRAPRRSSPRSPARK